MEQEVNSFTVVAAKNYGRKTLNAPIRKARIGADFATDILEFFVPI